MAIDWTRFVEVVRTHQHFLLSSHVRPDADALGSGLGLAGVLRALGKQVTIVNAQGTPPNLRFLDPENHIRVLGQTIAADALSSVDCIAVLDTSAWVQLGAMADVVRAATWKKIVVDHHVSQDDLGAELFKDTQAEATGRLIVDAATALGVALTPEIATPLFAALATDTGWFRFASASGNTYRAAGALIDAGAPPSRIYRELYEQDSLARLHLIGRTLARVEAEHGGRLVHTYVRRADFAELGALPSDTEDVINMTLQIAGTEVAVILVEMVIGGVKVSFRSRSGVDCSRLAEQFQGGGHKAAAGATLHEPFETVRTKVLDAVRAAMK